MPARHRSASTRTIRMRRVESDRCIRFAVPRKVKAFGTFPVRAALRAEIVRCRQMEATDSLRVNARSARHACVYEKFYGATIALHCKSADRQSDKRTC